MTIEDYERKKYDILYQKSSGMIKKESDCVSFEKCEQCKGAGCCSHFPCAFAPEEFLDLTDIDYMKNLLMTGLVVLSQLNKHLSYIRPRGKYDPPRIVTNLSMPINPCSLLTDKGCVLDHLFRPTEGLLVIPRLGCEKLYEPRHIGRDWSVYNKHMKKLAKQCNDMAIPIKTITDEDIEKYKRLLLKL